MNTYSRLEHITWIYAAELSRAFGRAFSKGIFQDESWWSSVFLLKACHAADKNGVFKKASLSFQNFPSGLCLCIYMLFCFCDYAWKSSQEIKCLSEFCLQAVFVFWFCCFLFAIPEKLVFRTRLNENFNIFPSKILWVYIQQFVGEGNCNN